MTRAKEDDARARARERERVLNVASPLNYSAVHTRGNRRTVKSMNPAMEFARLRRSTRGRRSRGLFPSPAFHPPASAVANRPGVLGGSARARARVSPSGNSSGQELRIAGIRNFNRTLRFCTFLSLYSRLFGHSRLRGL